MDLYLPQGDGPFPLVLWIHGGAWKAGDKFPAPEFALQLVEKGIAVASVNYRLTSDTQFQERTFPAQIHDVKGAVRFLRAQADEYHLDPHRFACWGSSAGGHLSALLGTSGGVSTLEGESGGNNDFSSRVIAAADYFGPTCFECMGVPNGANQDAVTLLLGHDFGDLLANLDNPDPPYPDLVVLMNSAGPVNHVDPTDPPFFVAHGDADMTVPPQQSSLFVQALDDAGVPVEFHPVPGAGHTGAAMPNELARAFLEAAFATWHFEVTLSIGPIPPTDAQPVTFTASPSGGTPPYSCSWEVDGARHAGNPLTLGLPAGGHTVTLAARDDTGAEVVASEAVTVLKAPSITSVRELKGPFRLRIEGEDFQPGCRVQVDGRPVPQTAFKSEGVLIAKSGEELKALLPTGMQVQITVANPDGAMSRPHAFTR